MPIIGFSNPYIAEYHHNGVGGTSYTNGMRAGRGVSRTLDVDEASSDNKFHCDNGEGESEGGVFKSAKLTLELAELTAAAQKKMLGAQTRKRTINGKEIETIDFNDSMQPPELGYGDIEKDMEHGRTLWTALVLKKVKFAIPSKSATTQKESIEWQTQSISADVKKDDTPEHSWQEFRQFDTEAEADAFVRHMLGIKGNEVEPLTIISAEGSSAGKTEIAVDEKPIDGRSYRYKTGADVQIPALYESLTSWSTWDGVSEIEATTGDVIVVAEVDAAGLAMAAGKTTVTAKGE